MSCFLATHRSDLQWRSEAAAGWREGAAEGGWPTLEMNMERAIGGSRTGGLAGGAPTQKSDMRRCYRDGGGAQTGRRNGGSLVVRASKINCDLIAKLWKPEGTTCALRSVIKD